MLIVLILRNRIADSGSLLTYMTALASTSIMSVFWQWGLEKRCSCATCWYACWSHRSGERPMTWKWPWQSSEWLFSCMFERALGAVPLKCLSDNPLKIQSPVMNMALPITLWWALSESCQRFPFSSIFPLLMLPPVATYEIW